MQRRLRQRSPGSFRHIGKPAVFFLHQSTQSGCGRVFFVRRGIVILSVASISVTTLCWILILIFPGPVLSLFSSDPELVEVGVRCVRLYFLGFFLQSQQFAGQHAFVALGKSKQAIFFSLLRKVVIVFPLTLLLPHLGGLGVDGVFLAEPVSNLLGGTSCFVTMLLTVWPMLRREEQREREKNAAIE